MEKENSEKAPTIPEQQDLQKKEFQLSLRKRLQSSIGEPLCYKNKCIRCMKGFDKRNLTGETGKLMRISTL